MINYESPLYIDIVLYTIYALLLAATVLTVWSAVRSLRLQGREGGRQHGVPARRIALIVAGGLVLTMAVSWLTAGTQPLTINGKPYTDELWLRASGMFITTALLLIGIIIILALYIGAKALMKRNDD